MDHMSTKKWDLAGEILSELLSYLPVPLGPHNWQKKILKRASLWVSLCRPTLCNFILSIKPQVHNAERRPGRNASSIVFGNRMSGLVYAHFHH